LAPPPPSVDDDVINLPFRYTDSEFTASLERVTVRTHQFSSGIGFASGIVLPIMSVQRHWTVPLISHILTASRSPRNVMRFASVTGVGRYVRTETVTRSSCRCRPHRDSNHAPRRSQPSTRFRHGMPAHPPRPARTSIARSSRRQLRLRRHILAPTNRLNHDAVHPGEQLEPDAPVICAAKLLGSRNIGSTRSPI